MKRSRVVLGVYDVRTLKWRFFASKGEASKFQSETDDRFGPLRFRLEDAMAQFSSDYTAINEVFVTEDEFQRALKGEAVELSLLSDEAEDSTAEEVTVAGSVERAGEQPEPGPESFEGMGNALAWLRESCLYIYNTMSEHADDMERDLEDYDYYDGFLSRIESLLEGYLDDIEKYELLVEHLYDGVDDTDSGDETEES